MIVQNLLVGLALIGGAVFMLLYLRRTRRDVAAAVSREALPAADGELPRVLAEAGFSEPVTAGAMRGARGLFEGVMVQALGANERSPAGSMMVWTFAVPLPSSQPPLRVSARPQGVRKKRGSLTLGLPGVDTRLDVFGDLADATELFRRAHASDLIEAITTHGWRLVEGVLVRPALTVHNLHAVALAGAQASKALAAPRTIL